MAKQLSDAKIQELSLVFKEKDGVEYEPMNGEARVLAVKGKGIVAKAIDTIKAYFYNAEDFNIGGYPVSEAPDNIDGDCDGPEDYNAIVGAVCSLNYDLQSACGVGEDKARSAAIVACIDSFLAGLDALRVQKAGAKHSSDTKAHIAAIADAHASMSEHLAALQTQDKASPAAVAATEPVTVPDGEVNGEKAAETDMTKEEVQAMIDASKEATKAEALAELQPQLDAAKAEAEAAKASELAAKTEADAAKAAQVASDDAAAASAADAAAAKAAAVNEARQPSAKAAASVAALKAGRLPLADQVRAALGANPIPPVI